MTPYDGPRFGDEEMEDEPEEPEEVVPVSATEAPKAPDGPQVPLGDLLADVAKAGCDLHVLGEGETTILMFVGACPKELVSQLYHRRAEVSAHFRARKEVVR